MKQNLPMPRDILFFAYDGIQPIDLAGPMQAFNTADEESGGRAYRVKVASIRRCTIKLNSGLAVLVSGLPKKSPDTLLLPGGPGVHDARRNPSCIAAVRRMAQDARRVGSICTGAFLLGSSGLLEGKQATTHWRSCARLAAEFPNVQVKEDPIWVRDGRVWSSAGVTAGIDLALALIEEDYGVALALRVARRLVVPMRRHGGQSQHSDTLELQGVAQFGPLIEWVTENLKQSLTTDVLAERVGMTPRTFHRHFLERTGATPAEAVERLRLDRARTLLETTRLPLGRIADQAGFGSAERLRRAFKRRFGIRPKNVQSD